MQPLFSRYALVVSMVLGLAVLVRPAGAQIDPSDDVYDVYEHGALVGQIYRIDPDPAHYTEHWVLFPGYVYPSAANGVTVELRAGSAHYRDAADFFARVPFPRGSRYVHANIEDGTALPGR